MTVTATELLGQAAGLLDAPALLVGDLPDNEYPRVELVDGSPYVTPDADYEHQSVTLRLGALLLTRGPRGSDVLAGVNVYEGDETLVIPDLAVTDPLFRVRHRLGVHPKGLRLVVEVTSPSTRRRDLTLKRDLYREWGVPYLIIDRRTSPWTVLSDGEIPDYALDLPLADLHTL